MFTSYEEARDWLHSRLTFGVKPGLDRMRLMMEKLGHPERNVRYVHVAGTNGKGSTIAFLKEILNEAGYEIGTFTSPYIETFNERISMNGKPITDEEFLKLANKIKPVVEEVEETNLGAPTEFEVITAMAFFYFGRMNMPDLVLLETGLGGTYDSTNIISPLVSIITSIGHDHMGILGASLREIAKQKAGIIKNGVPVITAVKQPEALQVIECVANQKKAKHYLIGREFQIQIEPNFSIKTPFNDYENVTVSMKGSHQRSNASLAVMAANFLQVYYSFIISDEHIQNGLEKTFWKGRFEEVCHTPRIIIDGAHNVEGVKALKETVLSHFENKKITVLFSALKDKEVSDMMVILSSFANEIVLTSFSFPRAKRAKELYDELDVKQKRFVENWREALEDITDAMTDEDVLIITGSLYFISDVRKYFIP
ncbi:folylpolyglutamate synthase/dihydrofolate synthase family protein [Bacillus sp. FJAT-47783]|uniref:bifunctional folylpolyglutamate synthase/dihydrofolate synthase n=1 Tax=Bacillus sp. FJAT-47783 TaxID=2922712 RepID=UPI001FACE3CF|nr:folylpolyglutamate synthase/dihydrofolate synthase family protein [Bacillus sp. FJAT-47783]